jgi:hypothetical protein
MQVLFMDREIGAAVGASRRALFPRRPTGRTADDGRFVPCRLLNDQRFATVTTESVTGLLATAIVLPFALAARHNQSHDYCASRFRPTKV